MNNRVVSVEFTSRVTPLDVREALQAGCAGNVPATGVFAAVADIAREVVILSTCNRYEVYAISDRTDRNVWSNRLATVAGWPASDIARTMRMHVGSSVEQHLLRVAAGLESQIVGETHVLGQVRRAYLAAADRGVVGPMLASLFRSAIHTGKRVHTETSISSASSIGSVVVDHLDRVAYTIDNRRVLIVGSGEVATDVATALLRRRPDRIFVVNRNVRRATELAKRVDGIAAEWGELSSKLRTADVCIVCTAANEYVITRNTVGSRLVKPCHIIDLGVPRNVEPEVASLPGVDLTHLDALKPAREIRSIAIAEAERIVTDELERLHQWQRARRVAPLINSLLHPDRCDGSSMTQASKRALHGRIMVLKDGRAA